MAGGQQLSHLTENQLRFMAAAYQYSIRYPKKASYADGYLEVIIASEHGQTALLGFYSNHAGLFARLEMVNRPGLERLDDGQADLTTRSIAYVSGIHTIDWFIRTFKRCEEAVRSSGTIHDHTIDTGPRSTDPPDPS